MRAPEFWERRGIRALLLAPLGQLYGLAAWLRRALVRPTRAGVPVVCVGALTVGGAGKTPTAIAVVERLIALGRRPHIVTRGYKGTLRGPVRVELAQHGAGDVGDEALLLAAAAPTWVARDRVAGAPAAKAAGADIVVLDDGFQNPSLAKDLSLLVIDAGQGLGNGRLLPAGPLRESAAGGLARAQGVVLIGNDRTGIAARIPRQLPLLRARLVPDPGDAAALGGQRTLAFAGIGRPAKFFDSLEEIGAKVISRNPFPDHHPYRASEIDALLAEAAKRGALPATTAKDAARLPAAARAKVGVLRVTLEFDRVDELDRLLDRLG